MTVGWRTSALVTQWLDIPEINLRNWILPHIFTNKGMVKHHFLNYFNEVDTRHMNERGQRALGE